MDYSFSEIYPLTPENRLRFVRESNRIEGIEIDDLTSPYISQHLGALDYIQDNKRISITGLHRILMSGLIHAEGEVAGQYKTQPVIIGRYIKTIPPEEVESDVQKLEHDIESALRGDYTPAMEWEFHNRFEIIHPFVDGNGRTGRLLLNFVRMHYFPREIVIVKYVNRYLYYAMLNQWRMEHRPDLMPNGTNTELNDETNVETQM